MRSPSAEQLKILFSLIIKHLMQLLTPKGYLIEEQDRIYMA
jgi:hypothetical protein